MGTALVTPGEEGTCFSWQCWQPLDLSAVTRAEQGAATGAGRQSPEPPFPQMQEQGDMSLLILQYSRAQAAERPARMRLA